MSVVCYSKSNHMPNGYKHMPIDRNDLVYLHMLVTAPNQCQLCLIVAIYWRMLVSTTVSQAICQLQLVCVSVLVF